MSLPVHFTAEAEKEFDEAANWYEEHAGLGLAFTKEVKKVLDRISRFPKMHQMLYKDVRRGVVRRFPYAVYYREDDASITVVAVFNSRRDPSIWQDRV